MRCVGEPGGAARQLVPGRAYVDLRPGAFTTPEVEEGEPAGIVKKSLTNPINSSDRLQTPDQLGC